MEAKGKKEKWRWGSQGTLRESERVLENQFLIPKMGRSWCMFNLEFLLFSAIDLPNPQAVSTSPPSSPFILSFPLLLFRCQNVTDTYFILELWILSFNLSFFFFFVIFCWVRFAILVSDLFVNWFFWNCSLHCGRLFC